MDDQERIWVMPRCGCGRTWFEDPVDGCDDCGKPPTAYIRADLATPLPQLEWRKDSWGKPRHCLYLGNLYAGSIMNTKSPRRVDEGKTWRGWFMSDDDGDSVGYYETEDEARKAVEDALRVAVAAAGGELT